MGNAGLLVCILAAVSVAGHTQARSAIPETAARCHAAARTAAERHAIPEDVMQAITLVETGRRLEGAHRPWPWTLNVAGQGYWFDTRAEALDYARTTLARGQRSFDLGCFQLNYRWHGERFERLDAMLDPAASADYAARFLAELYAETGNWLDAAGKYHSRTPKFFRRYRARVAALLEGADLTAPAPQRPAPVAATALSAIPATPGGIALTTLAAPRASLLTLAPGALLQ
ncbi:MAG: lytic transglycosylase domain-containing protein [Pseudomonadota bacterium]